MNLHMCIRNKVCEKCITICVKHMHVTVVLVCNQNLKTFCNEHPVSQRPPFGVLITMPNKPASSDLACRHKIEKNKHPFS